MMSDYQGQVYQAPSGQWSWRIFDDQGEVCGGAGYDDENSACEAMSDELSHYQGHDDAL